MIDVELANRFIRQASNYTDYNINVMNENGIIVASSDNSRVGSFHEVAYTLMKANKDVVEVTTKDNFQGGRVGINMALIYKRKKIGVLGVSGDPDKIRDSANMIKMAMEVMLDYEEQKKKYYQQQSIRTRFIDGLLYQEDADQEGELTAISGQLGYQPHALRIPVLVVLERQLDAYAILEKLKRKGAFLLQDIVSITRENNLIIFKNVPNTVSERSEQRTQIEDFIDRLSVLLLQENAVARYYVGTFQSNYRYYRDSFMHCRWLLKNCKDLEKHAFFFYDYTGEYMRDQAQVAELKRIFSAISENLDIESKDNIIELITTLERNNYNLKESSQELFIHKNTLIFRFNKIKSMFHVNPIQNAYDRDFLNWLVVYLKKDR